MAESKEIGNTALRIEEQTSSDQRPLECRGPRIPARIILGVCSWISLLGLLGILGGMDQGTVRFVPGMIWAVIFMAAWIASLAAGGWLE